MSRSGQGPDFLNVKVRTGTRLSKCQGQDRDKFAGQPTTNTLTNPPNTMTKPPQIHWQTHHKYIGQPTTNTLANLPNKSTIGSMSWRCLSINSDHRWIFRWWDSKLYPSVLSTRPSSQSQALWFTGSINVCCRFLTAAEFTKHFEGSN